MRGENCTSSDCFDPLAMQSAPLWAGLYASNTVKACTLREQRITEASSLQRSVSSQQQSKPNKRPLPSHLVILFPREFAYFQPHGEPRSPSSPLLEWPWACVCWVSLYLLPNIPTLSICPGALANEDFTSLMNNYMQYSLQSIPIT